jgi:hypothetical protein
MHLQHLSHLRSNIGHLVGPSSGAPQASLATLIQGLSPTIWFRGDESSGPLVDEITAMPASAVGTVTFSKRGGAKGISASVEGAAGSNNGFNAGSPAPVQAFRTSTNFTIIQFFKLKTDLPNNFGSTFQVVGADGSKALTELTQVGGGTAKVTMYTWVSGGFLGAVANLAPVPLGQWHMLVFRGASSNTTELWSSTGRAFYAGNVSAMGTTTASASLWIGRVAANGNASGVQWHDFCIFDTRLTDAQVASFQDYIRTGIGTAGNQAVGVPTNRVTLVTPGFPIVATPIAEPTVSGFAPSGASTVSGTNLSSGDWGFDVTTGQLYQYSGSNIAGIYGDSYYVPDGSYTKLIAASFP